jgi:malonyl CoA-acyl carrier protein transacylase
MSIRILGEIAEERQRQNERWGEQNHPDGTGTAMHQELVKHARAAVAKHVDFGMLSWQDILLEEVAEAFAETDPALLRAELVQVAAVATAWIEAIDRRPTH